MSVQQITPQPAALRPVKLTIIDYHTSEFLIVQGRSSKEYRFDYSRDHQALVYETNVQEDVDDLMRSNGLYGFFCVSVLVEKEPAVAVTVTASGAGAAVESDPASLTLPDPVQRDAERIAVLEADLAAALTRIAHLSNPPPAPPESKPAKRPYVRKVKQPPEG